MVKVLIVLCIVATVQVCTARQLEYQEIVPVFKQPYGEGDVSRIVGGETATRGQFPHHAAISIEHGWSFCSGSLISKDWILTAGHCVAGFRSWSVILGAQNILDSNEPGRVTVTSRKGILHELYEPRAILNDIGVVHLPQEVAFSQYINIIKLPPQALKDENLAGKTVRASGWGQTSDNSDAMSPTLQFVDLPLISMEECKEVYGGFIDPTKYCCSTANQKSTCFGDSGGPLTIGSGDELVNLGITSFGSIAGCAKGYPVGFTAIPHFVVWISNKTGIPITM